jgi:hypothetical protein
MAASSEREQLLLGQGSDSSKMGARENCTVSRRSHPALHGAIHEKQTVLVIEPDVEPCIPALPVYLCKLRHPGLDLSAQHRLDELAD